MFRDKDQIVSFFLIFYMASLALAKWWNLPVSGFKFQLPEVIFLMIAGLAVLGRIPLRWRGFDRLDWGVTALVGGALAGAAGGDWAGSLPGMLGLSYLYVSYLLFSRIEVVDPFALVRKGFLYAALLVSLGGIAGILWWYWAGANFLVHEKYLPYWGEGVRAASFVRHPDVVMNLGVYALIFLGANHWSRLDKKGGRISWFFLIVIVLGMLLSFSKFIILLPVMMVFVFFRLKKRISAFLKWGLYVLLPAGVLFFLLITHLFFISNKNAAPPQKKMEAFITDKLVWEGEGLKVLETAYLPLKRLAVRAGLQNIPFGIGMGQLPQFIDQQQQAGRAPDIPLYHAHSSYWGLWAEAGLLGGIGGLFFLYSLFRTMWKWGKREKKPEDRAYWIAVSSMLVYVLVEGLVLDGLFFRQHWWLLVMVSWRFYKK